MKLRYNLAIAATFVDLAIFILFVYVTLPFINPSVEEYNAATTSFPRDYNQKMLWYVLHLPTVSFIDSAKWIWLSVLQTTVIFFGLGVLIERFKKKTQ